MINGKCIVCQGKCDWFHRHNNPFYFKVRTVTEVTTLRNLKEKYYKAVQEKSQQETMMVTLESELAKVKSQVRNMVISLRTSINRTFRPDCSQAKSVSRNRSFKLNLKNSRKTQGLKVG